MKLNRSAFIPFSTGPQNCAGKLLAILELRAVVCAVLQKFELKRAGDFDMNDWERNVRDSFVSLRGPLPLYLVVRR